MHSAKGDSGKPRGKMNAYACFMQTCSEERKNKNLKETVGFSEFSKWCAGKWKVAKELTVLLVNYSNRLLPFLQLMTENEKEKFQVMAQRDKLRFEDEMRHYTPPQGATDGRGTKRKQVKDPNAPKCTVSSYLW